MHVKGRYAGYFLTISFLGGIYIFPNPARMVNTRHSIAQVSAQSTNHAPIVNIIQPAKNASFSWNTMVPYSIDVSDSEDGESKFQEIANGEVIVRLKFAADMTKATNYIKQKKSGDTVGLTGMVVSNCFNCHAVKTKLAGPSFQEISIRYGKSNIDRSQLINHIKKGSTGIWGKEVMPSHPELTETNLSQMVQWILNYANDPGLNYFVGLQGALPLNKPKLSGSKGIFIMTAFYTDHGSADQTEKRITGSGQVLIQVK